MVIFMLRLKFVLLIYIFCYMSVASSKEMPLIYISPNPNQLNIDLHAGSYESIKLGSQSITFSLSDILAKYSNLSLSQSGGIASQNQLRIRGGEANHVLVLIDGIEVNDPASGSEYDFGQLFLHNIYNIDILRGAYSNVHGPDAVSGVINIKTKNTNAYNLTLGSNNTNITNYSIAKQTKNFQYGIDINSLESSGTDDSNTSGGPNRFESENIRINIKSINHNFTLLYFDNYRQNDRDAYGNLSDNELATTDINQLYSKYSFKKSVSENFYIKNEFQYSTNKNLDFSPANGVWETLTQAEKFKLNTYASIDIKKIFNTKNTPQINLGFEYEKINFTQLVKDKTYGNGDQIQDEYGTSFSSEIIYPINNFQFELSIRRTINQRFSNQNTHRVGISYKNNRNKVFINHSSAFKNPTFTERYGYYPGTFVGNQDLKPENINQLEMGFSLNLNKRFSINQTYYNSKLKNEINGYTNDSNGNKTALNNNTNSYRRGLETKFQYNISKKNSITFSHDYVKATEYNSTQKKQLSEVRRPNNLFNIHYQGKIFSNIFLDGNIFYSTKIKDTDFSSWPYKTVYLKSYYLANATLSYQYKNKQISLIFKNIFNREYESVNGYNKPGLEFLINYKSTF